MSRTSSSWIESYLSALEVRDSREQAYADVYNTYTKLADHCAALASSQQESDASADAATATQPESASPTVAPAAAVPRSILGRRTNTPPATPPPTETSSVSKLRMDLSAAQKSKTGLATQLASVTAQLAELEASHGHSTASLTVLAREKSVLERRLKDRDSELREKRTLLERVQDEVVGLEMQVNVAEEEKRKLKEENAALVKRLVDVREVEVERVNRESGWGER